MSMQIIRHYSKSAAPMDALDEDYSCSLGLLQVIELLICFVQDEVIFSAQHISALERRYLNSLFFLYIDS